MSDHIQEATDKRLRLARRPNRLHRVRIWKLVVVVIDWVLSQQAEHRRGNLIDPVQCRAPRIAAARIIPGDGRAPNRKAIGSQLIAAIPKRIDIVTVREVCQADSVEIPRGNAFRAAAQDTPERCHRGVGECAAFGRCVSYRVCDRDVIIPFPIRIAAPRDSCVVTDLAIHFKPDADLVAGRHLGFEKLDKWSLHQRVVLEQPRRR